jgi:hypothetical protein
MTPAERDALISALTSAHRDRTPHGEVRFAREFYDLDDAGRTEAFEATRVLRVIDAALSPDGTTSTSRAVLARIRGIGGP